MEMPEGLDEASVGLVNWGHAICEAGVVRGS